MAIYSKSRGYLFIHVPRTGGTSIRRQLTGQEIVGKHGTAKKARSDMPERIWNGLLRFGTVRNPFDWAVSIHFYIKQRRSHPAHKVLRDASLTETLIWWRKNLGEDYTLSGLLGDDDGKILVTHLLRFEHLHEDWTRVATILGLGTGLLHENRSNRSLGYKQYYDDAARELAEKMFSEDCKRFGYRF